eukprot:2869966-Amphidinium_carterae.1
MRQEEDDNTCRSDCARSNFTMSLLMTDVALFIESGMASARTEVGHFDKVLKAIDEMIEPITQFLRGHRVTGGAQHMPTRAHCESIGIYTYLEASALSPGAVKCCSIRLKKRCNAELHLQNPI